MNWKEGRQGSGYFKHLIVKGDWFDAYILKFPVGSHVDWHVDPIGRGERHYRLNIFLKKPKQGGEFICQGRTLINTKRIQLFRPDIQQHKVTPIEEGTRYVLSIGWVVGRKANAC